MTNEWLEFQAYIKKPTYSAASKHDLSYLGRFTFKTITDFEGFGRILTVIARGYLFHNRGAQYYPLLELPEQKEVGKYGRLHLEYLKAYRKGYHTTLLMDGTLNRRLCEIDLEAKTMLESIITRITTERGIDENLKARDMLRWVAEMNNVKASAEENVLREVVYV